MVPSFREWAVHESQKRQDENIGKWIGDAWNWLRGHKPEAEFVPDPEPRPKMKAKVRGDAEKAWREKHRRDRKVADMKFRGQANPDVLDTMRRSAAYHAQNGTPGDPIDVLHAGLSSQNMTRARRVKATRRDVEGLLSRASEDPTLAKALRAIRDEVGLNDPQLVFDILIRKGIVTDVPRPGRQLPPRRPGEFNDLTGENEPSPAAAPVPQGRRRWDDYYKPDDTPFEPREPAPRSRPAPSSGRPARTSAEIAREKLRRDKEAAGLR